MKTNSWKLTHYLQYFCEIYTTGNYANVFVVVILNLWILSVSTLCPLIFSCTKNKPTFFHTQVMHKHHINACVNMYAYNAWQTDTLKHPAFLQSSAVIRVIYYHHASYSTQGVSVVPLSIDINISWHAVHLHLLQVCES